MMPSQTYFYRNRGPWDWQVQFELSSWSEMWGSSIPFFSKVSLSILIISQCLLGRFQMWTNVQFKEGENVVHHSTTMSKWGFIFYKSEKDFYLLEDGHALRLEGVEYFWPLSFWAVPFRPKLGVVSPSTTTASYKMPMSGTECECQTFLDRPDGYIEMKAPGLHGRFTLTKTSQDKLAKQLG